MAEILFILVTLYAVYVVHSVVTSNQKEKEKEKEEPKAQPTQASVKEAVIKEAVIKEEVKVVAKPEKPVVKKVASSKVKVTPKKVVKVKPKAVVKAKATTKTKAKKKAKAELQVPSGSVRNPDTGEIVKLASSYRMTKRWIKEALVTEGLLDKVYKISEIDEGATVKIDTALDKFRVMDKYL